MRVVFDRGGMSALFDGVTSRTRVDAVDPVREVQLFLGALYVGVGRDRRGEVLAAGMFIRAHAMEYLLKAWRVRLPAQVGVTSDPLDAHRRFEQAYPTASAELASALAQRPEPAAREVLAIAERELSPGWDEWPAAAVQAIRERLGWSAWN